MRKIRTKFVMYGFKFPLDRPDACANCRYWKNRKLGCMKVNGGCRYLLREIERQEKCDGCPYAKGSYCTCGACYKDLVAEMKKREMG